ncbi:hypothetical protein SDC9_165670 [bioreactor metagenome]|uniref:ABC transporter permease n=1 Tax=bioreactor metagenome TaxID=1076179 RepID=A0A645FXD2_9ZZZZ
MLRKRGLIHRAIWLFGACCMAGFLLESMESFASLGYVENRQGLLYGPFTPIYGVGALAMVLFRPLLKNRSWPTVIAAAAVVGTAVEYLWGWAAEALFGTLFWDYRHFPLQLDGRVNLLFTLFWGVLGGILLKVVYPPFCHFIAGLHRGGRSLVTWVLIFLMAANVTLSAFAFTRQRQRQRQEAVSAASPLEVFLDQTYPDQWMRETFPGMRLLED